MQEQLDHVSVKNGENYNKKQITVDFNTREQHSFKVCVTIMLGCGVRFGLRHVSRKPGEESG